MAVEDTLRLVDTLNSGFAWQGNTLTYSFPTLASQWSYRGEPDSPAYGVLSAQQAERFRIALQAWDDVIDLDFLEVKEPHAVGKIRVAFTDIGLEAAHAYYPELAATAGNIWLDDSLKDSQFAAGSYDFHTMVHELGHVLGLKHPHEASGSSKALMPNALDNIRYTVMSYNVQAGQYKLDFSINPENQYLTYQANFVQANGPMLLDILAAQTIYGAEMTTRTGDDVYRWERGEAFLTTLWDAGGNDTIDASNQTASIINLNAGTFSSIGIVDVNALKFSLSQQFAAYPAEWIHQQIDSFANSNSLYLGKDNLAIAYGVTIENAIGGNGNDVLIGNAADNTLRGGAGNDQLNGGAGSDWLDGGTGYDVAFYNDSANNYTFTRYSSDYWALRSKNADTMEIDYLLNMESIVFSDKTFFHSEQARQVYRLYEAAFNRTPDRDGLQYWTDAYVKGVSLLSIADGFVHSDEFAKLYPHGDNQAFLYGLYRNILERAPDAGGFAYWYGNMQNGLSAADVLLAFSDSSENKANLASLIDNGFWLA